MAEQSLFQRAKDIALPWGSVNSIFSIVVFTVGVALVGWLIAFLIEWNRERMTEGGLKRAWRLWPGLVGAIGAPVLIWSFAFSIAYIRTIAKDEIDLRANRRIEAVMQDGLNVLARTLHRQSGRVVVRSAKQPWERELGPKEGPFGPTFAMGMANAFKDRVPHPCIVNVSGASDTQPFAGALQWIIYNVSGCQQWDNKRRLAPSIDPLTIGHPPPGITIHWNKANKDGENIPQLFANTGLKLSSSNQMPDDSPVNLIWLEIGPGSPWK
jgi:hypothetical protein